MIKLQSSVMLNFTFKMFNEMSSPIQLFLFNLDSFIPVTVYKNFGLCFSKSVLNWTRVCQLLHYSSWNPNAWKNIYIMFPFQVAICTEAPQEFPPHPRCRAPEAKETEAKCNSINYSKTINSTKNLTKYKHF